MTRTVGVGVLGTEMLSPSSLALGADQNLEQLVGLVAKPVENKTNGEVRYAFWKISCCFLRCL
jgi:hypothetical protein